MMINNLLEENLKGSELELRKLKQICRDNKLSLILLFQTDKDSYYKWFLTIKDNQNIYVDLKEYDLETIFKKTNVKLYRKFEKEKEWLRKPQEWR